MSEQEKIEGIILHALWHREQSDVAKKLSQLIASRGMSHLHIGRTLLETSEFPFLEDNPDSPPAETPAADADEGRQTPDTDAPRTAAPAQRARREDSESTPAADRGSEDGTERTQKAAAKKGKERSA